MLLVNVITFSFLILCVSCLPHRLPSHFYSDSDESDDFPYVYIRPSFTPQAISPFSDNFRRTLEDLQKTLTRAQQSPQIPSFGISTFPNSDSDESGTSVSISSSGLGGLFNSMIGFGGDQDTENLKNETTVKKEVIDGHEVTIKESTYVTDNHGIKSILHITTIESGDSVEDENKASEESDEHNKKKSKTPSVTTTTTTTSTTETPETDVESVEPTGEEDKANEDEEDDATSTVSVVPLDNTESENRINSSDENKISRTSNSDENKISRTSSENPNDQVEEIDTENNGYFNYRINNDKIKEVGNKKKTA